MKPLNLLLLAGAIFLFFGKKMTAKTTTVVPDGSETKTNPLTIPELPNNPADNPSANDIFFPESGSSSSNTTTDNTVTSTPNPTPRPKPYIPKPADKITASTTPVVPSANAKTISRSAAIQNEARQPIGGVN